MATSSIIEKIRVNNPKVLEKYAASLEADANEPVTPNSKSMVRQITDPKEIKRIMALGIKNWSKKG